MYQCKCALAWPLPLDKLLPAMRVSISNLLMAFAVLVATPLSEQASGCVVVRPLPEDVHYAIQHYRARDLPWYLQDKESLDIPDPDTGIRPLMTALIWEKHKHFRKLLSFGADPDLTDLVGNSALHIAAQINEPGLVLELLEAGADPLIRNQQQQTFQRYLFMADVKVLSARTRNDRAAVLAWLRKNEIPLELSPRR
jgi:ankyrin repeat protein